MPNTLQKNTAEEPPSENKSLFLKDSKVEKKTREPALQVQPPCAGLEISPSVDFSFPSCGAGTRGVHKAERSQH